MMTAVSFIDDCFIDDSFLSTMTKFFIVYMDYFLIDCFNDACILILSMTKYLIEGKHLNENFTITCELSAGNDQTHFHKGKHRKINPCCYI